MKALRKLYDWVLHWADTPYGAPALFILSFVESSFFPVPPDPLLIALVLGGREKAFRFAANCTVASVLGALFGYAIGYFVWWSGPDRFSPVAWFFFHHVPGFSVELFRYIQALFEKWNFWIIFTAGFTPIPYKVFTCLRRRLRRKPSHVHHRLGDQSGGKVFSCRLPDMEIRAADKIIHRPLLQLARHNLHHPPHRWFRPGQMVGDEPLNFGIDKFLGIDKAGTD